MPSLAAPAMQGLSIEAVEWLPSGADSGLVRVRGRWADGAHPEPEPPSLMLRAEGRDHRFDSLPDARFARDAQSWRGSYLVPAALVEEPPEGLWIEWPGGARAALPAMTRGIAPPPSDAPEKPTPPPGGQVIDRAVLAERRARRAEAAEKTHARVAAEAVKAVETLELRSAELERRLAEATAEREAVALQGQALEGAAELRAQLRDWRTKLRAAEAARAADALRIAALESEGADRARELAAQRERLTAAEAAAADTLIQLEAARADVDRRTAGLRAIYAEARAELERRAQAAEAEAAALRQRLGVAEAAVQEQTVARAALEDELDRERASAQPLSDDLDAAVRARVAAEAALANLRGELAATTAARETASAALSAAEMELDDARASAAAATSDLAVSQAEVESLRTGLDALRADLESERAARRAAEAARTAADEDAARAGATLQDRIAELERRAAPDRLEQLAREQAEAAAARDAEPARSPDLAARLDAAAAALRTRAPEVEEPAAPAEPQAVAAPAEPAQPAARPRPAIVSPAGPPPRADVVGTSQRGYPLLRGALVKLAHDDPKVAGLLLAGLLPAQGALLDGRLAYDLTIHEVGTFGVDVADGAATAESLEQPRGRRRAAFHLSADALTLAELLAGVDHRIGRFRGRARVRGRRRKLAPLRALAQADLGFTAAARAGATLEPDLAWQALAYAVHPSWTKGLVFTVATTVTAEPERTWHLTARDGGGLATSTAAPAGGPSATVTMSRAAFDRLLRAEPHPAGERPSVRGDRQAVASLLTLIDRARGA